MDDDVCTGDGAAQPVQVTDVTDEETDPVVVKALGHLRLLELVAAVDPDGGRIPACQGGADEVLAELRAAR